MKRSIKITHNDLRRLIRENLKELKWINDDKTVLLNKIKTSLKYLNSAYSDLCLIQDNQPFSDSEEEEIDSLLLNLQITLDNFRNL